MTIAREANPFLLLTIRETAQLMGLSERHVRTLIEKGKIPCWRPAPQTVRIPIWALISQISEECGIEPPAFAVPRVVSGAALLMKH